MQSLTQIIGNSSLNRIARPEPERKRLPPLLSQIKDLADEHFGESKVVPSVDPTKPDSVEVQVGPNNVGFRPDGENRVAIDFGRDNQWEIGGGLQSGTKAFVDKMKPMLGKLKDAGKEISYTASKSEKDPDGSRRGKAYSRILKQAGFEQKQKQTDTQPAVWAPKERIQLDQGEHPTQRRVDDEYHRRIQAGVDPAELAAAIQRGQTDGQGEGQGGNAADIARAEAEKDQNSRSANPQGDQAGAAEAERPAVPGAAVGKEEPTLMTREEAMQVRHLTTDDLSRQKGKWERIPGEHLTLEEAATAAGPSGAIHFADTGRRVDVETGFGYTQRIVDPRWVAYKKAGAEEPAVKGFGQPLTPEEKAAGTVGGGQPDAEARQADPLRETALANARVDAERVKNGLPPLMAAARKANPEVWDKAMKTLADDPNASAKLAEELLKDPRPVSTEENALLLHRKIALSNEYERTIRAANDAMIKKNVADFDKLVDRSDELLKQIDDLDKVTKKTSELKPSRLPVPQTTSRRAILPDPDDAGGDQIKKRSPLTPEEMAEIQDCTTGSKTWKTSWPRSKVARRFREKTRRT